MLSWQNTDLSLKDDRLSLLVSRQRAWVEIDLQALADNTRAISRFISPQTELMAVVKADAYGHGAIEIAKTVLANGASCLAIATLAEGVELRQAGIDAPILILGAINAPEDIKAVAAWSLEPTICSPQQASVFAETLSEVGQTLSVHLKLDTGMSRLGTDWKDGVKFVNIVRSLPNLNLKSVYSHFATADDPDKTIMNQQHRRFCQVISQLERSQLTLPYLHIANSAAMLSDRSLHYDLVRVGLALYGLYPAPHLTASIPLKPVMAVKSKIAQIKTIAPGTGVSYGHRFVAHKATKIAVVGIGYADGVPRLLSNRLRAIVRGKLVAQIGTITMDQLMLDVSNIPDLQAGEVVTLIGNEGQITLTVDDWAEALNTISWEIICGFKHRLPRVNLNSRGNGF
ncbi:alanine racemase [Myxosarcina sp. GI1]|uniref:alanine racemase n=1 Tax=Myxosarcina sp. GI1 TaxID=1541065 RepID=UPI00055E22CC|nr:alanine racemase [Myxosarcina sp. GI1]